MPEPKYPSVRPIEEVLTGMNILPLPEGQEPEVVFVLMKTRSAEGTTEWSWRSPGITNHEELLGALMVKVEELKQSLLEDWG